MKAPTTCLRCNPVTGDYCAVQVIAIINVIIWCCCCQIQFCLVCDLIQDASTAQLSYCDLLAQDFHQVLLRHFESLRTPDTYYTTTADSGAEAPPFHHVGCFVSTQHVLVAFGQPIYSIVIIITVLETNCFDQRRATMNVKLYAR